ncbi:ABC transporter ATP-binding protein [Patescibacteria group bacterium]|nr:ABC transporter ATP-binding protein [Patescibacteria group bacterium]
MAIRRKKSTPPRMKGKMFTKQDEKLPPIVELKNVHRTYEESAVPVKALRGVNLTVDRGEMVAIMGPSGSGKTSLLNIIGLLDNPDEGRVYYAGEDLDELKRRKIPMFRQKEVGMIFQQKNLIPTLTAFENVYMPFRYTRGKRSYKRQQVEEALRLVSMVDRKDHFPKQLSGGEKQRVAVARSLVMSPAVVLADEPTGELDSKTGDQVVKLMEHLNESTGQTFIIVTHNELVAEACHRVVQMKDGQIIETATSKKGAARSAAKAAVKRKQK